MITSRTFFAPLFLSIGLLIQACHAGNLQLVIGGKPAADIVLPSAPTRVENSSALVLQDFVKRITGATLPVLSAPGSSFSHHLFIGDAAVQANPEKVKALKAEGYEIVAHQGNLYLYGGSGKGILYGAYELIEQQFGARKYDQLPATVTKKADLDVPPDLHMRYEPAFVYRESFYPPSADKEYLDWHHLQRFQDLWGVWGHTFFRMVPPERYFKDHPEYFALNNGRRQATQLCLSNPDVQALVIKYLKREIAGHPDALYWSIAQMDGGGYCTCGRCAKVDAEEGGPQGSIVRFVNGVAAHFPDQFFTTLAYGYSAEAPKLTTPAKNVYVMLSTIDATRQQPLASDPQAAAFRRQLTQWSKLTSNLFVWDYTTQFTAYLCPFPIYDHYQANIQYFLNHGIKGVFEQGSGETLSDMSAYASYMQAKLLWDPSVTAKNVEVDFLQGYYGPGGVKVKQYIDQLIAARDETETPLDIYSNPVAHRNDYLSAEMMRQYKTSLAGALEAVKGTPLFMQRINTLRLGLEYVDLEQARAYGVHEAGYLTRLPDDTWQVKPGWMVRVQRFVDDVQKAGGTEFSETGGTPQNYIQSWTDLLRQPHHASLIMGVIPVLSHPFIPDYPANRAMTLTDGVPGGRDYSYNWLLFEKGPLVITFPVKHTITPVKAGINFLFDPAHYIFLPDEVRLEGSADGEKYTLIAERQLRAAVTEPIGPEIHPVDFMLKGQPFSYLRVTIRFPDRLPDWFKGTRQRKPLIAVDEVSVE